MSKQRGREPTLSYETDHASWIVMLCPRIVNLLLVLVLTISMVVWAAPSGFGVADGHAAATSADQSGLQQGHDGAGHEHEADALCCSIVLAQCVFGVIHEAAALPSASDEGGRCLPRRGSPAKGLWPEMTVPPPRI